MIGLDTRALKSRRPSGSRTGSSILLPKRALTFIAGDVSPKSSSSSLRSLARKPTSPLFLGLRASIRAIFVRSLFISGVGLGGGGLGLVDGVSPRAPLRAFAAWPANLQALCSSDCEPRSAQFLCEACSFPASGSGARARTCRRRVAKELLFEPSQLGPQTYKPSVPRIASLDPRNFCAKLVISGVGLGGGGLGLVDGVSPKSSSSSLRSLARKPTSPLFLGLRASIRAIFVRSFVISGVGLGGGGLGLDGVVK